MFGKKKDKTVRIYIAKHQIPEFYQKLDEMLTEKNTLNQGGRQSLTVEYKFWKWVKQDLICVNFPVDEMKWGGSFTDPYVEFKARV